MIGEFNLNGIKSLVNPDYVDFKKYVIASIYFDILILPETHCLPNDIIEIDNYKIFQNNRPNAVGTRRGSGGIAIAVHSSVIESHTVVSVNKGVDGQISVKLKNKFNDFIVGVLALYLPPDNYIYGREPEMFFNQATVLWEDLFDCDLLVGGGDLNARTKNMIEYLPDIDGNLIPVRENPDQIKNKHADSFITFLKDNRSIILNGRITPQFNNYTFVSTRGCSVPDYLFSPTDHLRFCKEMRTILMSDIVNTLQIQPPKSLPDHSILKGIFISSFYENNVQHVFPPNFPKVIPQNVTKSSRPPKKNIKKMSKDFFMSPEIHQQVCETIRRIETSEYTQLEINELWSKIKNLFSSELNNIPSVPTSNNKRQNKLFRKSQPFWNADLAELWKTTCEAEKQMVEFKVKTNYDFHIKAQLRQDFNNKQKYFDKKFRETERLFKKKQNKDLENSAHSNPSDMWSKLKKLNNPPSARAALEIVRADESISRDLKEILERWLTDISKLFSGVRDNPDMTFDDIFYEEIVNKKREFENLSTDNQQETSQFKSESLNLDISFHEVSSAIDKTKFHKAYLEIPNEAMKNFNAKCILHLCFKSGLNPVEWDFSNIIPIPKKDKDQRDPLQNRCITIMCCVAKVYSKILNARIQKYLEENKILVEEQNGFRACRSCIDHLYVLCTVLRNRKLCGKETFLCYIDYKKALDSVERNLLLFKLSQVGITGNIYRAISSLYSNPRSRVILNEHETQYFDCPVGVKQGDCLSPTLFAIYINDLAIEIKNSNIGIILNENLTVNILLYADDIVLLAENEEDLQAMLFIVECWCKRWRLEINLSKTNIMHIRPTRIQQSKYMFLFDMQPVPYCTSYKYLGANIHEHLDFNFTVECLADSAGRALSSIITKMIKMGDSPLKCTLFCTMPV